MNIKKLQAPPINKKNVILYGILITLGMFLLYCGVVSVHAVVSKESVSENFDVFFNGFTKTTFQHMKDAYDKFSRFFRTGDMGEEGLAQFAKLVRGLGQALVIGHMLINIIQLAARGELIEQYWTKLIVTTGVAIIAIASATALTRSMYDIGSYIIDAAAGLGSKTVTVDKSTLISSVTNGVPGMQHLEKILGDGGSEAVEYSLLDQTNAMLDVLKYIAWLPLIACIFLTFSSVFEIKVREIFTPIAIASIASGGARSGGVRYLLKYLGCFFKIGIYFLIAFIGSIVMKVFYDGIGSGGTSGLDINLVLMVLTPIVTAMAMMQTGSLGDEILGV